VRGGQARLVRFFRAVALFVFRGVPASRMERSSHARAFL
jgi:hypothetical protein